MRTPHLIIFLFFAAICFWGYKYQFRILQRNEIESELAAIALQSQKDSTANLQNENAKIAAYIKANYANCNMTANELQMALDTLQAWCNTFAVEYSLILGQIAHESAYDRYALGAAGEVGWFQMKPAACTDVGVSFEDARDNVYKNIEAGVKYYVLTSKRNLSAYNQGLSAHQKNGLNAYPIKVFKFKKEFDNILNTKES